MNPPDPLTRCTLQPLILVLMLTAPCAAEVLWIEGESPARSSVHRHSWYDGVRRDRLSGGDLLSHFHDERPGEAEFTFRATDSGEYVLWLRANPVKSALSVAVNGRPETAVDMAGEVRDRLNIAADGKPDLRFIAWIRAGPVILRSGENSIRIRMTSENHNHGYLDCLVLTNEGFEPRGTLRPEELALERTRIARENAGWFAFDPSPDPLVDGSATDLRRLNEDYAGQHGFIQARHGRFVHGRSGRPVRFWGVNGPPHDLEGATLARCARLLAKYGVNLVRIHGGYFDGDGELDMPRVQHALEIVEAMKKEGIYSHFSIYFPLWFTPEPDNPWLEGYDGKQKPFAALLFNEAFQERYRQWWKALLTTPSATTGKPLVAEPAVMGLEIQNEDSFFFWTFAEDRIPEAQWRILERKFADWLVERHGSLEAALEAWGGVKTGRDAVSERRVGFRPLWNMFNEKTRRDRETAEFLLEVQTTFYRDTYRFLRQLGFRGVITASNWTTASPEILGPLEKLSYTAGDFLDRHGYFSCAHRGDNAAWSIRDGHTYSDRSALRFEASDPTKPRQLVHPAMDPHYAGKPSMISETTWNRPNRYRSEAPLYYAVYGALQDTDAVVHFALDGSRWTVKPRFFMQPWTLMSPSMMGQFPAAALIYRRGLVEEGAVLAEIALNRGDLLQLEGTPLPEGAALDELRLEDVPSGKEDLKPGQRIDPLIHHAGRVEVSFTARPASVKLTDLTDFIDHDARVVRSSTGQLRLDYGRGVLTIEAPRAQGVSGNLLAAGPVETMDLAIASDLDLGHVLAVALDDRPLATSRRMLLQVMSEEKATGFRTEPVSDTVQRIVSIGEDPWLVRKIRGTVRFRRTDASNLEVLALDLNGYPAGRAGTAERIELRPETLYYLIRPVPAAARPGGAGH